MTRHWQHVRDETTQPVEVLGWTQHGAIVIGLEPGWCPDDAPTFVRMAELRLMPPDLAESAWEADLTEALARRG